MFRKICILFVVGFSFSLHASDLIYPPKSFIEGHSTAQLTAEWWQWAMSTPGDKNPVRDLTGVNCDLGQKGSFWFLAGGFGSSKIHRTCIVPKDKILFFPLINVVYYQRPDYPSYSCEEAKTSAKLTNEAAFDLFAEIDGINIKNLKQYRVSSDKCFDVFARIPSYSSYPSASDGYWLLIKPLKKGRHTLKFGGKYNRSGQVIQDIEYELIVQ